jgi:hypothetical protein
MSIRVIIDIITYEIYHAIIFHYNENRNLLTDAPLEKLQRVEGGFQIKILDKQEKQLDPNEKIKQVRWSKKMLVPFKNYESFTKEETFRLFISMNYVLQDKVLYIIEK